MKFVYPFLRYEKELMEQKEGMKEENVEESKESK
jgi:hypothetical protein